MSSLIPNNASDIIDQYISRLKTMDRRHMGIIAGSVAVVSLYTLYRRVTKSRDDIPLVPYTWPLIGSTPSFNRDPVAFVEKWSQEYGPVFRAHLQGRIQTIIAAEYVRDIFMNGDFDFIFSVNKRFDPHLLADIDDNTFTIEMLRKVVMKLTTQLKSYTPRAVEFLDVGREEFLTNFPAGPVHLPHLYPLVQHMVGKASAAIFAGTKLASIPEVVESFKNITTEVGAEIAIDSVFLERYWGLNRFRMWLMGKFSKSMKRHHHVLKSALRPEIKNRIKAASDPSWERPDDMLQIIIETYYTERHGESVDELTEDLVKWLIALIFAAIHTTSENSTVVLYRILSKPGVVEELLEEQREVLVQHGISPDEKDPSKMFTGAVIKDLVKLDSACREGMRMRNDYLTLGHTYLGKKPITLSCGAVIKPGEDVIINTWYNHRNNSIQKIQGDDYTNYNPFRFVGSDRQAARIGDDFLVFGEGKHACPGRWFALQEMKTIISFLIRDYKMAPEGPITFPKNPKMTLPMGQVILEARH
ncbi:hypothetical protein O0I10_007824 [Lichtheimia ornata]|uniref:Cytochrome p450 n=1 Tax=Lichtheimia ornata TaxID=688661 RepID=A0AAD7V2H8_9FUNG|nr:uncharacterized protein O0I10_007824 [Lichtheimia ornata]KAJ8656501.1 hypothetical protein O0I10_007824 [Lichtheimia ornata]